MKTRLSNISCTYIPYDDNSIWPQVATDLLLENYLGCLIKIQIPEPHLRALN